MHADPDIDAGLHAGWGRIEGRMRTFYSNYARIHE